MAALFAATKLMAAGNCYMVTLTLTQGYSGEIWTVMADGRGSSQTMTNNVEMVVNDGQIVVVTHNNGCVQPADYLQCLGLNQSDEPLEAGRCVLGQDGRELHQRR